MSDAGEYGSGGMPAAPQRQERRGRHLPDGFGPALRLLREERGLIRKRLAELAEIDPSTITRLEHGERGPSREAVDRLARALRATPEEHNHLLAASGFLTEEAAALLDEPDLIRLSGVLADSSLTAEDRRTLLTYVRLAVSHALALGYGVGGDSPPPAPRGPRRGATGVRRPRPNSRRPARAAE